MKQHIYYPILMLTAALLLVCCADKEIIHNDDPNGSGGIGDNCSFQLLLPHLQPMTKASEEIGTEGENLINGVRIVLYGGASNQTVYYAFDMDIRTAYSGNALTASGNDVISGEYVGNIFVIQTKARSAKQGDYQMLIIANPTAAIRTATQSGKSISEVSDGIFNTTAENSMYGTADGAAAYFLMLNAQGLIDVEEENFYETRELAQANPITNCAVERVSAKVTCAFNSGYTVTDKNIGRFAMRLDPYSGIDWGNDYDIPDSQTTCPICGGTINQATKRCTTTDCDYQYGNGEGLGATVSAVRYMVATDFTWQVDITNKKSYWYRHLTYKAQGYGDESKIEKQGDTDRENFYAIDPNFASIDRSKLTDEFTYINESALLVDNGARRMASIPSEDYPYADYWTWTEADAGAVYVPENTMVKEEQMQDVTTRVIIKAILKRENIGNDTDGYTLEKSYQMGDFFLFKGGQTTGYEGYHTDSRHGNYYILLAEDVAKYAKGEKTPPYDYGEMVDGNTITVSLADAIKSFKKDNEGFDWNNLSNMEAAYSDNLLFYKNGEMFYEVPIEHFSTDIAGGAGKYGRFGVMRNGWYHLDIQSVLSMGAPTIPPVTNQLIEKEETSGT